MWIFQLRLILQISLILILELWQGTGFFIRKLIKSIIWKLVLGLSSLVPDQTSGVVRTQALNHGFCWFISIGDLVFFCIHLYISICQVKCHPNANPNAMVLHTIDLISVIFFTYSNLFELVCGSILWVFCNPILQTLQDTSFFYLFFHFFERWRN